ncbi:MAG: PIN domain-containing protein [Campylobacterota bacterium]|nr:PIN domain-containing protein [Campylobacterota bacterium]
MKYFIYTNIIIDFLNKKEEAIKKIIDIAQEEESLIYVNRLIVLESLRTIHFDSQKIFREHKEKLNLFEQLDILPYIYEDAISFSRYCHSKGIKLKGRCEAIDFLHFTTAKYYNLIVITNDKDFDKLEEVYQDFLDNTTT